MVCGTIRGCASNKITTTYINVVCIQIVLLWGSNQECGINWGKIVVIIIKITKNQVLNKIKTAVGILSQKRHL